MANEHTQERLEAGALGGIDGDLVRWDALAQRLDAASFAFHRDVYDFVAQHAQRYGTVPSHDQIALRFPQLQAPPGEFQYYLDELARQVYEAKVIQAIQGAVDSLSADPYTAATALAEGLGVLINSQSFPKGNVINWLTSQELMAERAGEEAQWLLRPYVALGVVTELTGKVKAGKSTLLGHIVRAVASGGETIGCHATAPSPVVWVSEEGTATLQSLWRRCGLEQCDVHILQARRTAMSWPELIAQAAVHAEAVGAKLLVVDNLTAIAGVRDENDSAEANRILRPLLAMSQQHNLGVIELRHNRKSGGDVGDSGRGASGYSGGVDILLDLSVPRGDEDVTTRQLRAISRFDATPRQLIIELENGAYVSRGTKAQVEDLKIRLAILKHLQDGHPGRRLETFVEVAEARKAVVERALAQMVKDRQLVKEPGRAGKGGFPATWHLP